MRRAVTPSGPRKAAVGVRVAGMNAGALSIRRNWVSTPIRRDSRAAVDEDLPEGAEAIASLDDLDNALLQI